MVNGNGSEAGAETLTVHIFPDEDDGSKYRVSPSGDNARVERTGIVTFKPTGSKVKVSFPAGSPLEGKDVTIDADQSDDIAIPPAATLGGLHYTVYVYAIDNQAKDNQDNDPELIIEQLSN